MSLAPSTLKYRSLVDAVNLHKGIVSKNCKKVAPFKINKRLLARKRARTSKNERPQPEFPDEQNPYTYSGSKNIRRMTKDSYRKLFMEHSNDILSSEGDDLNRLAENYDVDTNLPTKEKQEKVYEAMADTFMFRDKAWEKRDIDRQKKHFLETINKTHFINLTCSILHLKESVVRTWIKTDPEFALAVRSAQVRFGERVGHSVLIKALNGDMAAAMYVLKEFKDAVKFVDPQVEEVSFQDTSAVDNLTLEEQETLLYLTRKAKRRGMTNENDVSQLEVDASSGDVIPVTSEEKFIGVDDMDVSFESSEKKFADIDEEQEEDNTKEVKTDETIVEDYEGD